MLKVHNLVKTYRIAKSKETVRALDNVSINFPETGLVFLLGKSGSGKSTLLNAIGGLDTFDSGEIIIKGKSSADFTQADFDSYRNTFIGFIFQEYNILEEFTVAKNLSIALELQGKKADKEEINKLLEQVDMLEYAKRKPNQLSGGQKQRVAIARALIKNPEIIMADEPTGALDSNTGKQVMDTLKKLSETKLVIIVSHDREFAEIYGDRIIELKDGKIINDITKKEVEPVKTQSGVSIIDNQIIHIKKGTPLTNDDIRHINEVLTTQSRNTDILISIDNKANTQIKKAASITDDGNKEVFCNTLPDDIMTKEYNAKDFKLIKSSLKFKDSLKMGASALKSKVFKLAFTIFLSFIAFTMFGVIDTFSSFNRAEGVYNTIVLNNTKNIAIKKESKGKYSNYNTPITDADIKLLKEKFPEISFDVVTNRGVGFGSSYSYPYISIQGLENNSNNEVYRLNSSGMIAINDTKLSNLGFELTGNLPANNDEICISRHMFNCIKYSNPNTILYEDDVLNNYNSLSYSFNNKEKQYKIVGIIDDKTDISKYTSMSTEELNSNFTLYYEIESVFKFGYTNMLYVSQSEYDRYINQGLQISLEVMATPNSYSSAPLGRSIVTLEDYYNTYHESYYFIEFNNQFNLSNGSQAITDLENYYQLADDEVILSYNIINSICSPTITGLDEQTVLSGNYVIQIDNGYTQKELKIVGKYEGGEHFIMLSPNTLNELYQEDAQYHIQAKSDDVYKDVFVNTLSADRLWTIKDKFLDRYPFDIKFSYVKNVENPTIDTVPELTGLNAYVSADQVSSLGNENELIERINAGTLKLPIVHYTNGDEQIIANLNVIGLLSDSYNRIIVSDSLYDNTLEPLTKGYEYLLATLCDNEKTNKAFIKYCETMSDEDTVFRVQNSTTGILDNFGDIFNTLTEVFLYMGIAFAVFASLLLMNFISTSISYKKREIGILRALGARGVDVFGIFFKESFIIALINFFLATIATITVTIIINIIIMSKLEIDLILLSVGIRQVALIFGISTLAAFLASFIPTIRISKKKPIDAINNR